MNRGGVGGIRKDERMDVIDWMLDADPAIRWQVRRDVLQESDGEVAADRDRVAN